jgi:hypothetical protein
VVKEQLTPHRVYPVQCPACGSVMGYPTIVQTLRAKPGHIRIDISCHACKAQWFQEVDTQRQ